MSDLASEATAPARWLLGAGLGAGLPLTSGGALGREMVQEAARRWPEWWPFSHGPPRREADLVNLEVLHSGLKRLRLMRRHRGRLLTTRQGERLLGEPEALLAGFTADLGRADPWDTEIADVVVEALLTGPMTTAELGRLALAHATSQGWAASGGGSLEQAIPESIGEICRCGAAYGLISWDLHDIRATGGLRVSLTPAGAQALA